MRPLDFTYDELCRLMNGLGYAEDNQGRTSGSRVGFYNAETGHLIRLHKPHPAKTLKKYQVDLILEDLKGRKIL
jgi:hypothetical protein